MTADCLSRTRVRLAMALLGLGCVALAAPDTARATPIMTGVGSEPRLVEVQNTTSDFALVAYFGAFGCFGIVHGIGEVCAPKAFVQIGDTASHMYDVITTGRGVIVSIDPVTELDAAQVTDLITRGILDGDAVEQMPGPTGSLALDVIAPNVGGRLYDPNFYGDRFPTSDDSDTPVVYTEDEAEAVLKRAGAPEVSRVPAPMPGVLLLSGLLALGAVRRAST